MKKIISTLLVCVLLVGCVFALASCGKTISGTYKDALTGLTTYEFKGSKVTITAGAGNFSTTVEGKYEITTNDKDEEVIIFTFEDKDAEKYSGEFAFTEGKEGDTEYIKIGILKYNKVD